MEVAPVRAVRRRVAAGRGGFREVDGDRGVFLGAGGDFGEAGVEGGKEAGHVEAEMPGSIGVEVAVNAAVELPGPADVAVAEMIEGHGSLDEPLVELPRRAAVLRPEILPDLVALEVVALVELLDAEQVAWVVNSEFLLSLVIVSLIRHVRLRAAGEESGLDR
jgi:hypothetical protein